MSILKSVWAWVSSLWGNGPKEKILIAVFIVVVLLLAVRCSRAGELHVEGGAEYLHGPAPYLGLYYRWGSGVQFEAGTQQFGSYSSGEYERQSNWSWMAGMRVNRGPVFAGVGATYLQRIDVLNGSHAEYNLSLGYQGRWRYLDAIVVRHLSDAGTTGSNTGRNVLALDWLLQRD